MKAKSVLKLPEFLRNLQKDLSRLDDVVQHLNYLVEENRKNLANTDSKLADQNTAISDLKKEIELLRLRNTELEHQRVVEGLKTSAAAKRTGNAEELFADNHTLDAFYLEFENRFRGSEAEIQEKQKPYIQVFKKAKINPELPIIDIGSGRGEFIDLLKKNGFNPIGVDLNESMVKRSQEQGFTAVNDDAIGYLAKQPSNSVGGVTGFQLAEHIPFELLLTLIAEAYRCLVKDGILLLETPNPENLSVGAFTFHYDPSHLKPLPPAILQFAAEFKGFSRAKIMRVQPALTKAEVDKATTNPVLRGALEKLYGPRDYSLVAYK